MNFITNFFAAPIFSDEDTTRRAGLLSFLINLHLCVAFGTALLLAVLTDMRPIFPLAAFISGLPAFGLRILMRRGQVTLAAIFFLGLIFIIMPALAWGSGSSAVSLPVTVFQTITVVMAGLLLGGSGAAVFVVMTMLVNGALVYADLTTGYVTDTSVNPVSHWLMQGIAFSAIAAMLGLTNRFLAEAFARARNSEQRYRQVLENIPAITYLVDATQHLPKPTIYISPQVEKLCGYTREAFLQDPNFWASLIHPDDRPRVMAESEQADETGAPFISDYRILTKDGKILWFHDESVLIYDKEGRPLNRIGVWNDITDRKQAEQNLAQTARHLAIINEIGRAVTELNDLPTVLEIIRLQLMRVIEFDLYSVRLFNADTQTVTHLAVYESGRYWQEPDTPLLPGTDAYKVFQTGKPILNLLSEAEIEAYRNSPYPQIGDRTRMTASLIFAPLKKHGQTIGALSVQRHAINAYTQEHLDLIEAVAIQVGIAIENARLYTNLQKELFERTEAEAQTAKVNYELQRRIQELYVLNAVAQAGASSKNEDDLLESVVETLHTSLYTDIVGVGLWDPAAGLMRAHPRAHRGLPSQPVEQMSSPLGKGVVGIVAATRRPYRVRDVDDPNYQPVDPSIRSELCVPILAGEKLLGILNVESRQVDAFSDADETLLFTLAGQLASALERLRAEQQLRALNAQLEQRVAERTAELERANKELEAFSYSVSHDLRTPLRAINSYTRIIKDDFATAIEPQGLNFLDKVIAASLKMTRLIDDLLAFSRTSRSPLEKQTVDMQAIVQQVIEALGPELESRRVEWVVSDLPPAQADPSLIQQVYTNLLGNAVKYTSKIARARIEVGHIYRDDTVVYFVRDNGAGFDMRYADKLFGVFQRLHRDDEFEGTGIGLAIVKRIIERHGGQVWVESEVDKGTIFYFTLGQI